MYLGAQAVERILVLGQLGEAQDELGESDSEYGAGEEVATEDESWSIQSALQ